MQREDLSPVQLQQGRGEAKRRLVAEAAVLVLEAREAVKRMEERLEELKDGREEWQAIIAILEELFELPQRVHYSELLTKFVVYTLVDREMRRSVNKIARQFDLIKGE